LAETGIEAMFGAVSTEKPEDVKREAAKKGQKETPRP